MVFFFYTFIYSQIICYLNILKMIETYQSTDNKFTWTLSLTGYIFPPRKWLWRINIFISNWVTHFFYLLFTVNWTNSLISFFRFLLRVEFFKIIGCGGAKSVGLLLWSDCRSSKSVLPQLKRIITFTRVTAVHRRRKRPFARDRRNRDFRDSRQNVLRGTRVWIIKINYV